MRTFLLLVATLVAFTASSFVLPATVRGHGLLGKHHGAAPKVKATGKHHHKLKPPKPPKPPKPVKQGGLLHPHK